MRQSEWTRETSETIISGSLNLEGGEIAVKTGVGFFDHMLNAFAVHSGFGLKIEARGDLHVDAHHTVEDVGIVLGKLFSLALPDKTGINRFAGVYVPMDEALAFCAVDVCSRPYLVFNASFSNQYIGDYDTALTLEFMRAFAFGAGITLHLKAEYGDNDHHITEALFKALARALSFAVKIQGEVIPSTKGVL